MADLVNQILARPIQLADQITKAADEVTTSKQDCSDLKSKTEKLAALLRQAARSSGDLYERPARRIIDDTSQVLDKALSAVLKCRDNSIINRVFHIVPSAAFRKLSSNLENSIGDVSWLLRVSSPDKSEHEHLGLPPIAANEPILYLIWEQIAILSTGALEDRADAAFSLVSLTRDNDRNRTLIIEEAGVPPLLKLLKEGKPEGQENAAKALGLLGRDAESVQHMTRAGVCSAFAKILKEGPMRVQAMVAWAVSELAGNDPTCQEQFAQNNIIRLLVSHLAFETIQEHSKYAISSIHAVVLANNKSSDSDTTLNSSSHNGINEDEKLGVSHPMGNQKNPTKMHNVVSTTMAINPQSSFGHSNVKIHYKPRAQNQHTLSQPGAASCLKGVKELEDPETKANMKAMAARALWRLASNNPTICRSITESRALLCFAVLIEKGLEEIQFYSAMALAEITAVAEHNADLRRTAFKPNSPACKAVIEQLLKIIDEGKSESRLLIPCIKAIGNLARTFRATETRMIRPLVRLLDDREAQISREAAIALVKFACTENYLHVDHSKEILCFDGAKHLVQLVYFGEQMVQMPSLELLCHIALHVPDSEELAHEEVLTVLEWASKQACLIQNETVDALLQDAKGRLELYQSRGTRGFH